MRAGQHEDRAALAGLGPLLGIKPFQGPHRVNKKRKLFPGH